MKFSLTLFCSLFFAISFSQTTNNQDQIKHILETYFQYDRENIHVQFNKNIYVNNEDIAFKGYVINKHKYLPANTTNVQLAIYNEQKQLLKKQLLFTAFGTFEGGIRLTENFPSGKYYFHFYTNWMNNFTEDDSFTQVVEIISRDEPYQFASKEPNWKSAKIEFFPESGRIISTMTNKIGIKLTDCNQKGIPTEGKILDSKSNEIAQFKTNEMGNGAFYFNPDANEKYSVQIKTDKLNINKPLPETQNNGLVISYNNNLSNNILAIVVKTNSQSLPIYENKKLTLLIHQNGNSILKEFTFDPTLPEKTLRFDKMNLVNGVNTIRIIDENLNELAERLVYIETIYKPNIDLEAKTIANDSLNLSIKSIFKNSNVSISILPENNICTVKKSSILGTIYLNGYLNQPEEETLSFFDIENKSRKMEMELLLLNQNKNKYLWSNIKSNPPKIIYPLTQGITIKGVIEKKAQNSKYKISLLSMENKVFEETTIDKNNQFAFENVVIQDSTVVLLQIMDGETQLKSNKIKAKTIALDSISIFQPRINKVDCPKTNSTSQIFNFSKLSADKSIINLKDVVITGTSKKLVHKDKNPMAKAFKVGENELGTVLDYIEKYSNFIVGFDNSNSVIISQDRRRTSFATLTNGSPTVFIDDLEIFDLNFLFGMNINEVSEVYFDDSGISERNIGGFGTIKIYLKEGFQNDRFKIKNTSLLVTNAYTKNIDFKNAPFETAAEFNYFGTLSWNPNVYIKANQNQEVKVLKGNQKEIQVLLEGFSEDGQLISEIKKIPVLNP